jgi:hypothetical protein
MNWWITQVERVRRERLAIADLQENSDWLGDVKWTLSNDL